MIKDFEWHPKMQCWSLHFRLHIEGINHSHISPAQDWYALVDMNYPHSDIKIYPAIKNGINVTFAHQNFNAESKDYPWREGLICVNSSLNKWGRKELTNEPADDEDKLAWHIQRAVDWVKAAASDTLTLPGEPFELPYPPPGKQQEMVIFSEATEGLAIWQQTTQMSGKAQLKSIGNSQYVIENFGVEKSDVHYTWGKFIADHQGSQIPAIWVRLKKIPTLFPYQLPQTWKELFKIAEEQGVSLYQEVAEQIKSCKSGVPEFILLGFPIPNNNGEADHSFHWMAVKAPEVPSQKGFRRQHGRIIDPQLKIMFHAGAVLKWCYTENWHEERITARGKISGFLTNASVVMIGAGAIGSALSELLVRLGVKKMTVIDKDSVSVGNLSRHTLSITDTRLPKATQLAERLNKLSPHVAVTSQLLALDQVLRKEPALLSEADLVIDATADDNVIHLLSDIGDLSGKHFISVSIGLEARRLYCYGGKVLTNTGFADDFFNQHRPWIAKDKEQAGPVILQREGVGCWHPVFPARYDEILGLLNASFKEIERLATSDAEMRLVVAERQVNVDGNLLGINILRTGADEI